MRFLRHLYFQPRLFMVLGGLVVLFVLGAFWPVLVGVGKLASFVLLGLLVFDVLLVFHLSDGLRGQRSVPEKLSNGDENPISIHAESFYPFPVRVLLVDEIPPEFQVRNFSYKFWLQPRKPKIIRYSLRPVERGEYLFGAVNLLVSTPLGLAARRYKFSQDRGVPVYPSFIQMRKYELMAISNRLTELGIKKQRRIGQTMEFDQIRPYVQGDDIRNLNWPATARASALMVNQYQDERSQQVFCVVDMGRTMQMPFAGMTLLDYAINSSLVMCNTAMLKEDKAGLLTFTEKIESFVAPTRRRAQMSRILEVLYNQRTRFLEANYELLYNQVQRSIGQRSLLLLFTNFETVSSMRRNLPYLRKMGKKHLLVVIFFLNDELAELAQTPATDTEGIYIKTIAEKFLFEKRLIVKELKANGIHSVLTAPENLTVNTLNKYLELKARGLI